MARHILWLVLSSALALSVQAQEISTAQAEIMKQLIDTYAEKTRAEAAKAKGKPVKAEEFSVEKGRRFYLSSRNWEGDEVSACSTCHTQDPKQEGKHAVSKKSIKPLAPSVNPKRFTDRQKVEKNFSEHCQELYSRDCNAAEKGNFLTYLMSVK